MGVLDASMATKHNKSSKDNAMNKEASSVIRLLDCQRKGTYKSNVISLTIPMALESLRDHLVLRIPTNQGKHVTREIGREPHTQNDDGVGANSETTDVPCPRLHARRDQNITCKDCEVRMNKMQEDDHNFEGAHRSRCLS